MDKGPGNLGPLGTSAALAVGCGSDSPKDSALKAAQQNYKWTSCLFRIVGLRLRKRYLARFLFVNTVLDCVFDFLDMRSCDES
jgi:hypothetical protein